MYKFKHMYICIYIKIHIYRFVCVCVCVSWVYMDRRGFVQRASHRYASMSIVLTLGSVNHPTCILPNVFVCMICISITSNMLTCVALTLATFLLPPVTVVGLGSYTLCAIVPS